MHISVQVDLDVKCLLFQKNQFSGFLSCYMWTDRHGEANMCIFAILHCEHAKNGSGSLIRVAKRNSCISC